MLRRRKGKVLYSPGTNTEDETMRAIYLAGGDPELVFLLDLYERRKRITDCDFFVIPGGFSHGDYPDVGVGVAVFLEDHLPLLVQAGIPVLCICNGMQIAVRAGLLGRGIAMGQNYCETFVSRPVQHLVVKSNCVWTRGLEGHIMTFPSAHGYGYVVGEGEKNVAMRYSGQSPSGCPIAALTDDTGLILAVMDHPERNPDGEGLAIFRNGLMA